MIVEILFTTVGLISQTFQYNTTLLWYEKFNLINYLFSLLFPNFSACKQMEFGIQALFGPSDPLLGAHIQSICEALDIPHVEARLDFEPTFKEFSINLHPSQEHMNHAFKDLMTFLNWTKVAIVYEEDYGMSLVKNYPSFPISKDLFDISFCI